ncbi:DTW domain-containing protein [Myxococcota bacterium]|nr:DTW domain-containing protein [Myxococcota bacterium]
MGIRSKNAERCGRCRMHLPLCICASIPRLVIGTRLILVMHHREEKKPTATGPLALEMLPNSELRIHGRRETPLDFGDFDGSDRRTLLLYPGEDAEILSAAFLDRDRRPVNLIVPDGSWRQAARMGKRLPGLQMAERVRLPDGPPTRWGVRREIHAHCLSTFEAIARAMGILESPTVQRSMEELFDLMVERTFQANGRTSL